tara:strand:+ start:1274 stop:1522 length:249 start_codon:yes stop_codon:yes gene_type:complete
MTKKIFIFLISIYQRIVSPYLGQSCRYLPTCSEYTKEAISYHGVIKGILYGLRRILRCHPIKFLGGSEGYDPVPKKVNINGK